LKETGKGLKKAERGRTNQEGIERTGRGLKQLE